MHMVECISKNLENTDLSNGNFFQNMIGIAHTVAGEMRPALEKDPASFQQSLSTITEIFQEAMDDSVNKGEEIPQELKSMINMIKNTSEGGSFFSQNDGNDEITSQLENLITEQGLNREEFYSSISGSDGSIDAEKLESFLKTLN
jgi:polyhydroxyalkanoate synthesis regulator phasin